MDMKYPTSSMVVGYKDQRIRLTKDEPWDATDPLVKDRPELFRDEPDKPRRSTPVEQATASHGETRKAQPPAKPRTSKPKAEPEPEVAEG